VSPVGVSIENNGVRETDAKYRDDINKKILEILDGCNVEYITLQGSNKERIKQIMRTILL
jgi:hypothetical protein